MRRARLTGRWMLWAIIAAGCGGAEGPSPGEDAASPSALEVVDTSSTPTSRLEPERFEPVTSPSKVRATHVQYGKDGSSAVGLRYQGEARFKDLILPATTSQLGTAAVVKLTAAGEVAWVRAVQGSRLDTLLVDDAGAVFVTGAVEGASSSILGSQLQKGGFLAQLTASGEVAWARNTRPPPGGEFTIAALAGAPNRRFIAAANRASDGALLLMAYRSADGQPEWLRELKPNPDRLTARAVAVDAWGQIYLAGQGAGPNPTAPPYALLSGYTSRGELRWSRKLSNEGYGYARSVDTRDGHLAVGFYSEVQTFGGSWSRVSSYDLSGNLRWSRDVSAGHPSYAEAPLVALGPSKELLTAHVADWMEEDLTPGCTFSTWYRRMQLFKFDRVGGGLLTKRESQIVYSTPAPNCTVPLSGFAEVADLALRESDGRVALVGEYQGSVDLGLGAVSSSEANGYLFTLTQ